MENIRHFFDRLQPQSDEDWQFFSSKLVKKEFPKKALLLEKGQIENHLSFIKKGIVRFYIPEEEQDLTFGFAFEGEFFSAYDSFLTRMPSTYNVQTLSETHLWQLSYEDLQEVYQKTGTGNLLGRKASEGLFLKKQKRELALLQLSAEERYVNLFRERPEVIRQIPLKYIASYIGITPQALSRIRKRIS